MTRLSLRRRLPREAVAWFVVAGACAILAFASVRDLARRAASAGPPPRVEVVVAANEVEAGTVLDADQLTVAAVVAPGPRDALTAPGAAVGALALTAFAEGEPVTTARLARPGGPLVARVPPGLLGVPITVAALPEGLQAGDRIDVLATFTSARPYTTAVASDVTVIDVPTGGAATFGGGTAGRELLVLVSPEVARQLVQAGATGSLAVAVRGYQPFPVATGADG